MSKLACMEEDKINIPEMVAQTVHRSVRGITLQLGISSIYNRPKVEIRFPAILNGGKRTQKPNTK